MTVDCKQCSFQWKSSTDGRGLQLNYKWLQLEWIWDGVNIHSEKCEFRKTKRRAALNMDISDTQPVICDHQEKIKEVKLPISRETKPCACSWPLSPKVSTTYSRGRVNLCKSPVCSGRHSTDLHDLPGMQVQHHCKLQPHVWRYWPLGLSQTNHSTQTCSAVTAKTVNAVVLLLEGDKINKNSCVSVELDQLDLPAKAGRAGRLNRLRHETALYFFREYFQIEEIGLRNFFRIHND